MQIKKLRMMLLFAFSLAVLLNGCGSSNKSGSLNNVATVGETICIQCHGGTNFDKVTGEDIVVEYQRSSPHIGDPGGCEACHGGGAQHNGVGPIPFPSPDIARCQTCHNGKTAPITSAQNYATSQHTNLAHQSGVCIRCHTNEGALLSNMVGLTGGDITPASGTFAGQSFYNRNIGKVAWPYAYTAINCDTCHEHGAGLRSVFAIYSTAAGRDTGKTVWNPSKAAAGSPTGDRQTDNKNNQFNLCTSCHNMYDYSGTNVLYSGTAASGTLTAGHHNASWYRLIASTHKEKGMTKVILPFANMSSDASGSGTRITGYVIRKVAPTGAATAADATKTYYTDPSYNGPCFDCHGHEAKTTGATNPTNASAAITIHTDWAQSVHAGNILGAKKTNNGGTATDATDKVMHSYTDSSVWSDHNWDSTLKTDGSPDSGACQKCHTATGISNYLNNPTTYDYKRNDFSHLLGWNQKIPSGAATGGSKRQNEVLYCWGCHSNAGSGTLRNPGIPVTTTEYTYNNALVTFPDVSASNICVVCHTGRGNNDTIRNTAVASRNATRSAAHHASTGATLFSAVSHVGYEFTGVSYANPSYFQHDKIGVGSGGTGPCASCHMGDSANYGKASHTFQAISSSTTGVPSKIYNQALCNTCHTGSYPMDAATLATEKADAFNATQLLVDILSLSNGQTNYHGVIMNTNAFVRSAGAAINDYGAVQNSLYFGANGSDPGAYVHNRMYIKRLIFDSIDWAKNGSLTGSITVPLTYTGAVSWFNANATTGVATRP